MKSRFDLEIHDSRSMTTRRRYKTRLWFFLILLLLLGGIVYFMVPKIIKPNTEAKKTEVEQPAIKEQIIKPIRIPNLEDLKNIQPLPNS
jgi:hypothetical protein